MIYRRSKRVFVLLIPRFEDVSNSYYAGEIIKGVSFAASRLNIDVLVHIVDREDHRRWLDSSLLDRKFVSGIIFADIDNDINVVKKAIRYGMPCLVLNNMIDEPINCIAIDNKRAAFDLVERLIQSGHRQIATITGDQRTQAGELRLEGYLEALKKHGIRPSKTYIKEGNFLRTPAREAAKKLLKLKKRPTAVFAASDVMALELIDVAKTLGISVPQELSVIGFDDNPINMHSSVGLSTVAQPLIEMGRMGAENLNQICLGRARLPVKIMLSPAFIHRKSDQRI